MPAGQAPLTGQGPAYMYDRSRFRSARKTAKKKKLNVTIEARSASEANELLSTIDVLLIGPHYAKEINKFQELANPHGVAVALIPEDIYGSLDGERLIAFAQTLKN